MLLPAPVADHALSLSCSLINFRLLFNCVLRELAWQWKLCVLPSVTCPSPFPPGCDLLWRQEGSPGVLAYLLLLHFPQFFAGNTQSFSHTNLWDWKHFLKNILTRAREKAQLESACFTSVQTAFWVWAQCYLVHSYNPSTREADAGRCSGPAWLTCATELQASERLCLKNRVRRF